MPVLKNNEQDTFQMLENLALNGVMESSEQVWRRLTKNNTSQQVASCVLCILTCDRPKAFGLSQVRMQSTHDATCWEVLFLVNLRHTCSEDSMTPFRARFSNI